MIAQTMPSPAASSSFILTGKQETPVGGHCPSACDPGTRRRVFGPICHSLEWSTKELQVTDPPLCSL